MNRYIPYGKQNICQDDIDAVVEVLESSWLTTGPKVNEFENNIADFVGAKFAVAVSNGTAALHTALYGANIVPGDEVIVPTMTFAATANAVVYMGAIPIFCDVNEETLLIDTRKLRKLINRKTKAIIAVDYAGQPCDYDELQNISSNHGLLIIADAAHSIGSKWNNKQVGTLADLSTFSFHPVKNLTTAEGGMIVTDSREFDQRMRIFRNHGINNDQRQREAASTWYYEMIDLGFNYRLSDLQCALGISQLKKLPGWIECRKKITKIYNTMFDNVTGITPLKIDNRADPTNHIYVVKLQNRSNSVSRNEVFQHLRANGVGVNVHYIPVHLHPYYRRNFGTYIGQCPIAEAAYEQILTLPIYPELTHQQQLGIIDLLLEFIDPN